MNLASSLGSHAGNGWAGSAGYSFQGREVNVRAMLTGYTREYVSLTEGIAGSRTHYQVAAGFGYGARQFGSLSADYSYVKRFAGDDRQWLSLSYSRELTRTLSFMLVASHIREDGSQNELQIRLNYFPGGKGTMASATYRQNDHGNTETIQIQKNTPAGEGVGYALTLERTDSDAHNSRVNPYVQYNGKYATCSAEFNGTYGEGGHSESGQFQVSGAFVYANGVAGFTRPVSDSFAVVQVSDLSGVQVFHNNQDMGKTDATGKLILPNLLSFNENFIKINDKDIPIDYALADVGRFISPAYRSGMLIRFAANRIQGFSGSLKIRLKTGSSLKSLKALEFQEARIRLRDGDLTFMTGKDGEFYLENIPSGEYAAMVVYQDRTYRFSLRIPETKDMMVNIGEIILEDNR